MVPPGCAAGRHRLRASTFRSPPPTSTRLACMHRTTSRPRSAPVPLLGLAAPALRGDGPPLPPRGAAGGPWTSGIGGGGSSPAPPYATAPRGGVGGYAGGGGSRAGHVAFVRGIPGCDREVGRCVRRSGGCRGERHVRDPPGSPVGALPRRRCGWGPARAAGRRTLEGGDRACGCPEGGSAATGQRRRAGIDRVPRVPYDVVDVRAHPRERTIPQNRTLGAKERRGRSGFDGDRRVAAACRGPAAS
jgi:hypothetical protein